MTVATVVITTRDRPTFARRALDSALCQSLRDLEVVVVDDGSASPFTTGVEDPRVRVVRHEAPRGVCAARNAGIAVARGEWITFLDDDDRLAPEMLERAVEAARGSRLPPPVAANVAVQVRDVADAPVETLVAAPALERGLDYFLEERGATGRAANGLVVPTPVMLAIGGFDEQYEAFEHHDLGLRLNAVASIAGVDVPLYWMTAHPDSRLSYRFVVIPAAMERTLAKHADAFARHRAAHARFLGKLAYRHLEAGHWWPAIRWGTRAVRRNPSDRGGWRYLAAALAGPAALGAFRRVRPRASTVSLWELTKRRARKYGRRLADYPRAVVAAPVARAVRATVARRVDAARFARSVALLSVYRARNAEILQPLVAEARDRGWEVRLWALDHPHPALAAETVGHGPGAKFPLLDRVAADLPVGALDWVVVVDDDVEFRPGSVGDFLAVAEAADLDFVQPAHTERSHRDNEIGVRWPASIARRTTFVEIGPVFAVRRPWIGRVLPFPVEHTMGWGLELDWFDLEGEGARLGIVDAVPVCHLQPVGKGYAKAEERVGMRMLLDARGLDSIHDIQRVKAAWRPWRRRPPWHAAGAPPAADQKA